MADGATVIARVSELYRIPARKDTGEQFYRTSRILVCDPDLDQRVSTLQLVAARVVVPNPDWLYSFTCPPLCFTKP